MKFRPIPRRCLLDVDIAGAPALIQPYYDHGRIATMDVPPERVRIMVANDRAGMLVKPGTPVRAEELPVFPPDALTHMEDFG